MFEVKVRSFFSAAHYLRGHKGNCENLHGHNWRVEVTVCRQYLNQQGLVIDFSDLKKALAGIMGELDHRCLNELEFFKKHNPSSENIAKYLYQQLRRVVKKAGCRLTKVDVWEQRDSCASYSE